MYWRSLNGVLIAVDWWPSGADLVLRSMSCRMARTADAPSETPSTSRISPRSRPRDRGVSACRTGPLTEAPARVQRRRFLSLSYRLLVVARFSWYAAVRARMHQWSPARRNFVVFWPILVTDCCAGRKDRHCALPMCNVSPYSLAKGGTRSRVANNKRGRALGIALPFAHLAQEEN